MDFFDIRKMPVNLWRNGAGETREICCFPSATRDFHWRASIASIASNGEFSLFPGVDRVITLLEGGEVTLDAGHAFCHTLKRHQPFSFAGDHPEGESHRRADVDGFQYHDEARLLPGKSARRRSHLYDVCLTRGRGVCAEWRVAVRGQTPDSRSGRKLAGRNAHATFTGI